MKSLFVLLLVAASAQAAVLRVPAQFSSVQAAVDAALPGDTIVVSGGLYAEAVMLSGKQQLVLRGSGVARLDGSGLGPALTLSGCSSVTVRGLRFVGGDGVAVRVDGCSDVVIADCRLHSRVPGAGADAMEILSSQGVKVRSVAFAGSEAAAALDVGGSGGPVSDLHVSRCLFLHPAADAVHLAQVAGGAVERNVARDAGLGFVSLSPSVSDVEVRGNRVVRPGDTAVLAAGSGVVVKHNVVREGFGSGVFLQGSGLAARDNRIGSVGGYGVLLSGSDHEVTGNRVAGCAESGVAGDGVHFTVSDNQVSGAQVSGLSLTGSGHVVERNQLAPAPLFDLYLAAPQSGVHDNVAAGADGLPMLAAIYVSSSGQSCTGNQVSGSGWDGFVLLGQGGVVSGNSALGCAHDGLSLQGTAMQVSANEASGSGHLDLFELHAGANVIDGSNIFGSSNVP